MENVILVIHLILALSLIGIVLLQRSEGGGMGLGGGGGGGLVSARAAATALGKITWGLAIAFIATSITLTVLAAQKSDNASVVGEANEVETAPAETTLPGLPADALLPPPASAPSSGPRAD